MVLRSAKKKKSREIDEIVPVRVSVFVMKLLKIFVGIIILMVISDVKIVKYT